MRNAAAAALRHPLELVTATIRSYIAAISGAIRGHDFEASPQLSESIASPVPGLFSNHLMFLATESRSVFGEHPPEMLLNRNFALETRGLKVGQWSNLPSQAFVDGQPSISDEFFRRKPPQTFVISV